MTQTIDAWAAIEDVHTVREYTVQVARIWLEDHGTKPSDKDAQRLAFARYLFVRRRLSEHGVRS